ncbi:hypothetical protein [Aliikangiella maris]|uniref:Uncharacterized protein n=2 Tax=Aliikangiella maris TaxID=3162458 RepID=A0ABV3MTV9_9GAMM
MSDINSNKELLAKMLLMLTNSKDSELNYDEEKTSEVIVNLIHDLIKNVSDKTDLTESSTQAFGYIKEIKKFNDSYIVNISLIAGKKNIDGRSKLNYQYINVLADRNLNNFFGFLSKANISESKNIRYKFKINNLYFEPFSHCEKLGLNTKGIIKSIEVC